MTLVALSSTEAGPIGAWPQEIVVEPASTGLHDPSGRRRLGIDGPDVCRLLFAGVAMPVVRW